MLFTKRVDELVVGDLVKTISREFTTVSTIAKNEGTHKVYNLTTTVGEYYANGILVHNCDALRYGLMYYDTSEDQGMEHN